jgi:hypothetical protein
MSILTSRPTDNVHPPLLHSQMSIPTILGRCSNPATSRFPLAARWISGLLARIIREFGDKRSLLCYKHVD